MSTLETFECHEAVMAFINKNGLAGHGAVDHTGLLKLCRSRMVLEELGELAIAMHEYQVASDGAPDLDELLNLRVKIADGLADLLYVSQGLGIIFLREPLRDAWNLDLNYFKPQSHLEDLISLSQRVSRVLASILDPFKLRLALWDLHIAITVVAIKGYNLPFREVFLEVQRSNMTKVVGNKLGEKGNQIPGYKGPGYEPPRLLEVLRPCCVDGSGSNSSSVPSVT